MRELGMTGRGCGIISEQGRDCREPSVSGSPLNLCAKHLRQAAELYASVRDQAPSVRLREPCPECQQRALVAFATPPTISCALCPYERRVSVAAIPVRDTRIKAEGDPVVYYIRFGDRIKIGTTASLRSRLAALPHDELLAVERGGRDREASRHKQFAHLRITRRGEWFNAGADLLAHCDALKRATVQPVW